MLHQLHWLPVSFRINFKILPLTFKAIHELAPSYINDLVKIKPLHLRYRLRSNDRMLLSHLNFKTLITLGDRAFVASEPNIEDDTQSRGEESYEVAAFSFLFSFAILKVLLAL